MKMAMTEEYVEHIAPVAKAHHEYLVCSACDAALVDICITNPEVDVVGIYQAKCPFCGDESFQKEVTGLVCLGGCGVENPDREDDYQPSTGIPEVEVRDNIFYLLPAKATSDAKPCHAPA